MQKTATTALATTLFLYPMAPQKHLLQWILMKKTGTATAKSIGKTNCVFKRKLWQGLILRSPKKFWQP